MSISPRRKLPPRPPRYSDEPPQAAWPSFIEKLLLTIIDAHPPATLSGRPLAQSRDRQRRLNVALNALLGIPLPRGNPHLYNLHALISFARDEGKKAGLAELENMLGVPQKDRTAVTSKRAAAKASSARALGNSRESRSERLRKSARTHAEYINQIAVIGHHGEEEDMYRDLVELRRILSGWNVAASIDVEALGLPSMWGSKQSD
jgi:hypothetical protein